MKISVLMTTYNGQAYLLEQIRSINNQTRQPDEVIICDDCSTDNTTKIIKDFIKQNSLTNWQLIVNEENKGWMRNFVEGLNYVTGDVVFFSDQDDIWYPDKIAAMSKIMQVNPGVQCLAGGVNKIDGRGEAFGEQENIVSIIDSVGKEKRSEKPQKFNVLCFLGCTVCISEKLAKVIREMAVTNFPHDQQTWRLAALLGEMYILKYAVIKRRMHGENTSGVVVGLKEGASNLEKRKQMIKDNLQWLDSLMKYSKEHNLLSANEEEIVRNTIMMQEARYSFLERKNPVQYLGLLKYMKYYSGFGMYLGDFVYAHNINAKVARIIAKVKRY